MDGFVVEFWHWWVLAVVLTGAEMLIPGAVLVWLGAAAAIVGAALGLFPSLDWRYQLLLFALLSIVGVLGARRLVFRRGPDAASRLNRRADSLIGATAPLEVEIKAGRGRARVGDSQWAVTGPDLPVGTTVRVIGVDGNVLRVERDGTA